MYWIKICNILFTLILICSELSVLTQSNNACSIENINSCYSNQPFPVVDFAIEKKFESVDNTGVYQSPLLADVTGDCIPEIIIAGTTGFTVVPRFTSGIQIIDSQNGQSLMSIPTAIYSWHAGSSFVVGDFNSDGAIEIIIAIVDHVSNPINLRGRIVSYDLSGNINWISDTQYGANTTYRYGGTIGAADFNQDGIPEIYIYNEIFNAQTGVKLCDGGPNGLGLGPENTNQGSGSVVIAANLDSEINDLELAAGYTIYKVFIINPNGIAGNNMTPFNLSISGAFHDGFTSIGDINNDGITDVICAVRGDANNSKLYAYYLNNNVPSLIAQTAPTVTNQNTSINIGPPFIGDIDGSGSVSIGICRPFLLLTYKYNGTSVLQTFWQISTNDASGETGLTMFDFNQDGIQEIVYRDETNLRIINGAVNPPTNLATFSCASDTGIEHPIVGDIDNTGESKICVSCGLSSGGLGIGKLEVFGAPTGQQPWAPSRGVWNQYAYHVFNINDDLTIPTQQLNNATHANGVYNNFYVQESLLDEDGNFVQNASDLSGEIDCISYDWITDEYTITFSLSNAANASMIAPAGIAVSFFNGNPEINGSLIGTFLTNTFVTQGDTLNNLSFTFTTTNLSELFMTINADGLIIGMPYTENTFNFLECSYANNIIQAQNLPIVEELNESICANQTFNYYNSLLDESGIYYFALQDINGCDSIMSELNLTVNPIYSLSEKVSNCDTYTWPVNGQAYMTSGSYSEILQTQLGCDSLVTLMLTINESNTIVENLSSCGPYTWAINGQTYNSSGIYNFQTTNEFGCQVSYELNLTINQSSSSITQVTACDSYFWSEQTYTESGTYTYQTVNALGCDSVSILNLIINNSQSATQTINSCGTYFWPVNGQTYTQSGSYTTILSSLLGCDSLVTLNLNLNSEYNIVLDQSICEGQNYVFNEISYTQSETIIEEFISTSGCDSIVTLNLTVYPLPSLEIADQYILCKGQSINLSISNNISGVLEWSTGEIGTSITVNQPGDYEVTLITPEGCETSGLFLVLEYPVPDSVLNTEFILCPGNNLVLEAGNSGSTFLWNNGSTQSAIQVDQAGVYTVLITNNAGCTLSAFAQVEEYCEPVIYVPNCFTPNNDGFNDYFMAKGVNIDEFEMTIFNRWGQPIFRSFNINDAWNGSFLDGSYFVPDEAAPWVIRYKGYPSPKDPLPQWKELQGHVIVLR